MGYNLTPQTLLDRLKQAVKRRNTYIHSGQIEDYGDISGDIALIRLLVSIWILDLLEYPLDKINEIDPDLIMIDWAMNHRDK
jgi:hypothetical protein